jgi:hypothetical protein
MDDQNVSSRAPPSFARHVKPLELAGCILQLLAPTVSRRVDVRQAHVKINAESLSQHDEKHVAPTPLSGIRVGRRRRRRITI